MKLHVLAFLVGASLAAPAGAQIVLHVDAGAPGGAGADGLSWAGAFTDLRSALAAAEVDPMVHEIRVAAGVYTPDAGPGAMPGDRAAAFALLSGVAIRGGYAGLAKPDPDERDPALYISALSGEIGAPGVADNSYRVATVLGVNSGAILDGFTITGGFADGAGDELRSGAGARIVGGEPTFIGCRFVANSASGPGGAVFVEGGAPTFERCAFVANSAKDGAGATLIESTATFDRCDFVSNAAGFGGAVLSDESSAQFEGCFFIDNQASNSGGGAAAVGAGALLLDRCVFRGNRGADGGAIFNDGGSASLLSCVIGANQAEFSGGGVYNRSGSIEIVNSAISGNLAPFGAGVYNRAESSLIGSAVVANRGNGDGSVAGGVRNLAGLASLLNTIVSANAAAAGPQLAMKFAAASLSVERSSIDGGEAGALVEGGAFDWGATNLDGPPQFVDALGLDGVAGTNDDDLRLAPGSPCIDAGDNSALPTGVEFDLAGAPRFVDDPTTPDTGGPDARPPVDIGPLEFRPCPWDLDGDGVVGAADIAVLLASWGRTSNAPDLAALLGAWGACP